MGNDEIFREIDVCNQGNKKKHGQSASEIWGKQKNSMELTEGNTGNEEIFVEIAVIIYGNHEHNVELSKRN
jgi:hypothetical protein